MKKKLCITLILLLVVLIRWMNVSALEIYYTNANGINLTKEEYNFLTDFYWDGYQKNLTIDEYNYLFKDGIATNVESKEYIPFQMLGTSFSSSSKSLKISKASVSNYYLMSITVNWLVSPKVRSYDVIGSYLGNITLVEEPITYVRSNQGITSYNNLMTFSNGYGVSVKLPNDADDITIIQTYKVNGSGKIYASYQHATSNISLNNSKKYTISLSGYGNVFAFDNSIKNYYDQMNGVDISI